MNIFKNGVGRPSNETLRKRNIIKIGGFLLVALVCIVLSYSLSKIGTKRLSGTVIKSEDKISLISANSLGIDIDRYELGKMLRINNDVYIIIGKSDGDDSSDRNYYLAAYDGNLDDESNWLKLEPEGYFESATVKATTDGGIVFVDNNRLYKYNLDGTYSSTDISYDKYKLHIFNDGIYVNTNNSENNITFSKFDNNLNLIESGRINYQLQNSEIKPNTEYNYIDIYFASDGYYLLYTADNSYDKSLFFIKLDLNNNRVGSFYLNKSDLNINSSNRINFDELVNEDYMEDYSPFKEYDDRIEYLVNVRERIHSSGDSSDESSKNYLRKIVINKNTFEVSNIVEYDDERINIGRNEESISGLMQIDMKENYDIMYKLKMEFSDDYGSSSSYDSSGSYDSGSDSSTCGSGCGENVTITISALKVDKQGNVISESSKKISELINTSNVEYGDGYFLNNILYIPFYDIDTEELKMADIKFSSANGMNIEDVEGGKLTLNAQGETFSEGENIEFTLTPNEGYKFKELKFFDKDGNDVTSSITVTNNTFKMPAYGVVVKAIFEKDGNNNETTYTTLNKFNPSTYDNIMKFIIVGVVSLIVVAGSVILVIKNKKK